MGVSAVCRVCCGVLSPVHTGETQLTVENGFLTTVFSSVLGLHAPVLSS